MTVYTVRFCDKELVANNLRDFARIAVFAKWYLRTQSLSGSLHCSMRQAENLTTNFLPPFKESINSFKKEEERAFTPKNNPIRQSRVAVVRKAVRAFFYTNFY
ncbi:MAG: hypothetical protein FD167_5697 [bacterium]|nr:MAG: hypothetical protein FD167_5697 [bacterium]